MFLTSLFNNFSRCLLFATCEHMFEVIRITQTMPTAAGSKSHEMLIVKRIIFVLFGYDAYYHFFLFRNNNMDKYLERRILFGHLDAGRLSEGHTVCRNCNGLSSKSNGK